MALSTFQKVKPTFLANITKAKVAFLSFGHHGVKCSFRSSLPFILRIRFLYLHHSSYQLI